METCWFYLSRKFRVNGPIEVFTFMDEGDGTMRVSYDPSFGGAMSYQMFLPIDLIKAMRPEHSGGLLIGTDGTVAEFRSLQPYFIKKTHARSIWVQLVYEGWSRHHSLKNEPTP